MLMMQTHQQFRKTSNPNSKSYLRMSSVNNTQIRNKHDKKNSLNDHNNKNKRINNNKNKGY